MDGWVCEGCGGVQYNTCEGAEMVNSSLPSFALLGRIVKTRNEKI